MAGDEAPHGAAPRPEGWAAVTDERPAMPLPPTCPTPDCDDRLWKDTAHTSTDWDNWRWWCCRCRKQWYPTAEQLQDFRYGTSRPAAAHRDPRAARR
ncbi:hypothetical protein NCG97_14755 [Streptomyces lydicamycinicus]|nr:hypothetical protein [Streptomyces lydicamycinicus]USA01655.1 hypothetical protein NCG97_14755 [Streptomyces lydicamycinicus]